MRTFLDLMAGKDQIKPQYATIGLTNNHSALQNFRLKSKLSDFEQSFFQIIFFAVSHGLYCKDCRKICSQNKHL